MRERERERERESLYEVVHHFPLMKLKEIEINSIVKGKNKNKKQKQKR
jgi:hypothetical protein